jgi:hypothetical protein
VPAESNGNIFYPAMTLLAACAEIAGAWLFQSIFRSN